MNSNTSLITGILLLVCCNAINAQLHPIEISKSTPYYINVNTTEKATVYDLHDGQLNIQYEDRYGYWKQLELKVFNWKSEQVGAYALTKDQGLNHYTIDLTSVMTLEENAIYRCQYLDEGGNTHEWYVRHLVDKPKDIAVDIFVNPVDLNCRHPLLENQVEFYATITEGRAPYSVRWYVTNDTRTDFLYQPKEEMMDVKGKTSVLNVSQSPNYFVVLDVTDACGANARKVVQMRCDNKRKSKSTIALEPLPEFPDYKNKTIK